MSVSNRKRQKKKRNKKYLKYMTYCSVETKDFYYSLQANILKFAQKTKQIWSTSDDRPLYKCATIKTNTDMHPLQIKRFLRIPTEWTAKNIYYTNHCGVYATLNKQLRLMKSEKSTHTNTHLHENNKFTVWNQSAMHDNACCCLNISYYFVVLSWEWDEDWNF